ncbi:hypothetical protein [Stenotrophomonas phage phiSHP3]|nr:hypothetical protein [Stenotrophomonas phage phiSHP3]
MIRLAGSTPCPTRSSQSAQSATPRATSPPATPTPLPHCGPPSNGRRIRSWPSSAQRSPNWMPVQIASLNSNAWRHSASRP